MGCSVTESAGEVTGMESECIKGSAYKWEAMGTAMLCGEGARRDGGWICGFAMGTV